VTPEDVDTFERCIAVGGVALFPADTVYGLATEPDSKEGVYRLYRLKGRSPDRPAAVMFFRLELALAALPELGGRTRAALRVPRLEGALAALAGVAWPVLQSSANRSGGPDARRVEDVDQPIRSGVDLILDGGELPGTPSTVVDLSSYELDASFEVLREGAVPRAAVEEAL
jgi:L-threonylcarbamoyladenylate synthase